MEKNHFYQGHFGKCKTYRHLNITTFVVMILAVSLFSSIYLAPEIYATDKLFSLAKDDGKLRVIDQTDGSTISSVTILVEQLVTPLGGNGLAFKTSTGELFAILRVVPTDNAGKTPSGRLLVTINPSTGVATPVGFTFQSLAGIAFGTSNTLYAVTGDGGSTPETLFTLSADGTATLVCFFWKWE